MTVTGNILNVLRSQAVKL